MRLNTRNCFKEGQSVHMNKGRRTCKLKNYYFRYSKVLEFDYALKQNEEEKVYKEFLFSSIHRH